MKDIDAQIQKDERRELLLRRKRAVLVSRTDLLEFTRLTMPHPDSMDDPRKSLYVTAKHHKLIANVLMAVERGDEDRVIIAAPPRHGKTQLTTKTAPAWYMGRNPKDSVIVATYNEKFSVDLGRAVRNLMRSKMFEQVFLV